MRLVFWYLPSFCVMWAQRLAVGQLLCSARFCLNDVGLKKNLMLSFLIG